MIKVATPILYESALDELNRVRPLLLGDRGRLSLDYPVLCKNPVGTGRPCIGKLARCDEQGALLKNTGNSFKNYEVKEIALDLINFYTCVTFTQKVSCVSVRVIGMFDASELLWIDSTYTKILKTMTVIGNYFLPFKGKTIYFYGNGGDDMDLYFAVYGFY